jgi:hypothetical protein
MPGKFDIQPLIAMKQLQERSSIEL